MTTYVAPSVFEFKARFAAFHNVNDVVMQAALDRAGLMVDDGWLSQEDFTEGRMLLTAHFLTLDGHGTGSESQMAAMGALGFSSIGSGQLSLTRSAVIANAKPGSLASTTFGLRFLAIAKQNVPSVLTV